VNLFETYYLKTGDGIRLHIRIKGRMGRRPPVLYLHGGPGGGLNLAAFETYAGPFLETSFPVAYLHQRGVLRSMGHEKVPQRLSLHIQDISTVVSFLIRRFRQPRVYLIGHSWGGYTGCAFMIHDPSKVAGFVAICPVVNFPNLQQELYAFVASKVRAGTDPTANRELTSIGKPPYPDIDDFIRLQGLGIEAMGDPYRYIEADDLVEHTGYSIDRDHCLAVQTQIAATLWPELYTQDLTPPLEMLSTPMLIIACDRDGAVPQASVEKAFCAYGRGCSGVDKQWLLIEGSSHLPFTEPAVRQRCMDRIIDFLKSLDEKREPAESRFPFEQQVERD
jgi:pimeloyl-ACP methyl ester carboxylesterase